MNMKNLFYNLGVLMLVGLCLIGCSSDGESENTLTDHCFTGQIKYIVNESGSVQVVITQAPDPKISPIIIGSEVGFSSKELTNSVLQVGDIIDFKIIEYERTDIAGPVYNPMHFVCKVKPCK